MTAFPADDQATHIDLEDCQDEVDDLRAALRSRPVIDQAKGILMSERGCTANEAFEMLSAASQRGNEKLRDVARRIVDGTQSG
jgi:AmiR/NasT family two-component response regulator